MIPYAIAVLLTILTFPKPVALIAIYTLGIADPLAAVVGIRWGTREVIPDRSIEGMTAYFVAALVVAATVLTCATAVEPTRAFGAALVIACAATAFELVPLRLDDNLTIPLFVGFTAWITCALSGIASLKCGRTGRHDRRTRPARRHRPGGARAAPHALARELIDAAIARLERLDPTIHAVVHPALDLARAAATAPDLPDGPFRGVPFLMKDIGGAEAGRPYCCGMRFLRNAGWVEPEDAWLTRRFKAAGLISLGRTNTPELALLPTTEPDAFGATRNP